MTVAKGEVRANKYIADGATSTWDFSFEISSTAEIIFKYYDSDEEEWTTVSASDYSISGLDDEDGGTITYPTDGTYLASGLEVYLQSNWDYTQSLDIAEDAGFSSANLETQLDDTTKQLLQVRDAALGAPRLAAPETFSNTLPAKSDLAGNTIAFDDDGEPIVGPTVASISAAETNAEAAAASAAAAATSATEAAASATAANVDYEEVKALILDEASDITFSPTDDITSTNVQDAIEEVQSDSADTYVPMTRTITAGTGLTGGGALSADLTLAASIATQAQAEAGTDTSTLMTPECVAQAISALGRDLPHPYVETSFSAVTSADLDFSSLVDDGFTEFSLEVFVPTLGSYNATAVAIKMLVSEDGGSSFLSSGYSSLSLKNYNDNEYRTFYTSSTEMLISSDSNDTDFRFVNKLILRNTDSFTEVYGYGMLRWNSTASGANFIHVSAHADVTANAIRITTPLTSMTGSVRITAIR